MISITPGKATISQLEEVYWNSTSVRLHRGCRNVVDQAAEQVNKAVQGNDPVYGVNTGFGKLASMKIEADDTIKLQRNLIMSHCCGVGEPMPEPIVRLMMSLKLLSFGRGASGVRWQIIELLEQLLEAGCSPTRFGRRIWRFSPACAYDGCYHWNGAGKF